MTSHGPRFCARVTAISPSPKGHCDFAVTRVGANITLTITGLRPHTTYFYAVAARDNLSARIGPRSQTVKASTR